MVKKELRKIIKEIKIKRYSTFSYYALKTLNISLNFFKIFYPFILLMLIILFLGGVENLKENVKYDINQYLVIFQIVLTLLSVSIALLALVFNKKNEDLFDYRVLRVIFYSRRGIRTLALLSSSAIFIIFMFLSIFNKYFDYALLISLGIFMHSLDLFIVTFKILFSDESSYYFLFVKNMKLFNNHPKYLTKFNNHPNIKSVFIKNEIDFNVNLSLKTINEQKLIGHLLDTLEVIKEKLRFNMLSNLEQKNLLYFLEKTLSTLSNQNELVLLSLILLNIQKINVVLIEQKDYKSLYLINYLILKNIKNLPEKKFFYFFNQRVVSERILNLQSELIANDEFDKYNLLIDEIELNLYYRLINKVSLNRIIEIYIKEFVQLIENEDRLKSLIALSEEAIERITDNYIDQDIDLEHKHITTTREHLKSKK